MLWIVNKLLYTYYDHHADRKSDATIWSVTLESSIMLLEESITLLEAMFVERKVRYSALFTNLVRWQAGVLASP
jgi:hypothetical protein